VEVLDLSERSRNESVDVLGQIPIMLGVRVGL
jgi:hypothetical protein